MIKLHLGCGKRNFGPSWTHIDGGDFEHLHSHNIINLPFDDNSVDIIYACHVLEYFDREEAAEVLGVWYDKLAVGGTLRLAVPDFETMVKLYRADAVTLDSLLGPLYGKMLMGQDTIYHKTVYDYSSLKQLLELVGFNNVDRYQWTQTEHSGHDDHSQAYIPHMDKDNGTLISLNVECIK